MLKGHVIKTILKGDYFCEKSICKHDILKWSVLFTVGGWESFVGGGTSEWNGETAGRPGQDTGTET